MTVPWGSKRLTPETLIKRDVRRYLAMKGWFAFPILQGIGSMLGICDIIAIKDGRVLFIECKTPTGRQSKHQQWFENQIISHGGTYWIVKSALELAQDKGI